jgi:hypothetical protein
MNKKSMPIKNEESKDQGFDTGIDSFHSLLSNVNSWWYSNSSYLTLFYLILTLGDTPILQISIHELNIVL